MFRLSRSHTHKSLVPKAVAKVRRAFCPHAYSPPRSLRSAPFCHPAPCSLARVLHRTRESPPPVLSRPPAPAVQHAAPAAARRVPHTPHRQCHPCPARRSVCGGPWFDPWESPKRRKKEACQVVRSPIASEARAAIRIYGATCCSRNN